MSYEKWRQIRNDKGGSTYAFYFYVLTSLRVIITKHLFENNNTLWVIESYIILCSGEGTLKK